MRQKRTALGSVMLVVCALIWGSGFVVMKTALDEVPVSWLLGIRFTGGAAVLALCFLPRLRRINRRLMLHGLVMGALIYGAYMAQTWGLKETSAGKNAFITASYCVLVPFSTWLITKKRPTRRHVIAGLLCLVGIGLISLSEELTVSRGDALTLLCGVIFAFQVTMVAFYGERDDVVLLTILQIGLAGILFLLTALMTEPAPAISGELIGQLAYLILLPTALCNLMQNVGQTMVPAATAGILLATECVFGTMWSVLLLGERLTPRLVAGFVIVFVAVALSQTGGSTETERSA